MIGKDGFWGYSGCGVKGTQCLIHLVIGKEDLWWFRLLVMRSLGKQWWLIMTRLPMRPKQQLMHGSRDACVVVSFMMVDSFRVDLGHNSWIVVLVCWGLSDNGLLTKMSLWEWRWNLALAGSIWSCLGDDESLLEAVSGSEKGGWVEL